MLDVVYEEVVDDLEGQARRMIEYLGLPWDDRCLDFHQTRRLVGTASNVQVRRPVYRSAVARWRRYAAHLGPLLAELGDELRPSEGCSGRRPSCGAWAPPLAWRSCSLCRFVSVPTACPYSSVGVQNRLPRTFNESRWNSLRGQMVSMHNVQRVPSELDALIVLARRLHRAGRLAEVAATYRKILAIQPDFAEVHNDLGIVLCAGEVRRGAATLRASHCVAAGAVPGAQQPGKHLWPAAPVRSGGRPVSAGVGDQSQRRVDAP